MSVEVAGSVVGNVYDKYGTKNPLARAMMGSFLRAVTGFYAGVAPRSVLEVGCGEGRLAQHLVTSAPRLPPTLFAGCSHKWRRSKESRSSCSRCRT